MQAYSEYKDSGVEWLGEIPAGWEVKQLKRLSTVKRGASPRPIYDPKYFDDNGEWAWVRIADVSASERYLEKTTQVLSDLGASLSVKIYPEGFFLSIAGTVGKPIITKIKCCIHDGFVYFPFLKVNSEYLYYIFSTGLPYQGLGKFGTQLNLNTDTVGTIYMPLPDSESINNIVVFLDNKVGKIERLLAIKQQQIDLLKERQQILIQNAVTQGLNPNVPKKDSGIDWIGEIPAHWEMRRVKNIFSLVINPASKNNSYELLSIYTDIGVRPRKDLEERGNKASTTDGYWIVKKGDFIVNKLLAWMGAIGISEYEGVTSPAYDILRARLPISGRFYHFLFRSKVFSSVMKRHSKGIMDMRLRLYFDKFGTIEVPFPNLAEQKKIVNYISSESKKINTAIQIKQQQIEKLNEYKTTLINAAVTGKIKVPPH